MFRSTLSAIACLCLSATAYAQSNFIPLEGGEIVEKTQHRAFAPGLEFSGMYRAQASQVRGGITPSRDQMERDWGSLFLEHDLNLLFKTTVNRNMTVHLEFTVGAQPFNEADLRQGGSSSRNSAASSQSNTLSVRQAFMEYNANPKSVTRVGIQEVNLGDRRGKVFSGVLSGLHHACKAGTWCYDLDVMKVGNHSADWLYSGSLSYPVFNQPNSPNPWKRYLNIEIFRTFYTERDVPLAMNGGPHVRDRNQEQEVQALFAAGDTRSLSLMEDSGRVFDRRGNAMHYDAFRQEYFGVRIDWRSKKWSMYLDFISNQGQRRYHLASESGEPLQIPDLGESSEDFKNLRAKESVAGTAMELEVIYDHSPQHTISFHHLQASGDKEKRDSTNLGENYLRSLNGYYEIVPGAYDLTRFYFNGNPDAKQGGTGLGHSINNTSVVGFGYKFIPKEGAWHYRGGLYQLKRVNSVLNEDGDSVNHIGEEWDNMVSYVLDKDLHLDGELNIFLPGDAFSFSDTLRPVDKPEQILHAVVRARYEF